MLQKGGEAGGGRTLYKACQCLRAETLLHDRLEKGGCYGQLQGQRVELPVFGRHAERLSGIGQGCASPPRLMSRQCPVPEGKALLLAGDAAAQALDQSVEQFGCLGPAQEDPTGQEVGLDPVTLLRSCLP